MSSWQLHKLIRSVLKVVFKNCIFKLYLRIAIWYNVMIMMCDTLKNYKIIKKLRDIRNGIKTNKSWCFNEVRICDY